MGDELAELRAAVASARRQARWSLAVAVVAVLAAALTHLFAGRGPVLELSEGGATTRVGPGFVELVRGDRRIRLDTVADPQIAIEIGGVPRWVGHVSSLTDPALGAPRGSLTVSSPRAEATLGADGLHR